MPKIVSISQEGVDLIKSFEGFKNHPYLCAAGVPTIGWGTTRYPNGVKVTLNDSNVSEAQAEAFLRHDLHVFEQKVDEYCTDALNQHQFDALVSFAYNVGYGALKSSSLLKKINANQNDPTIPEEFRKWCRANGKILAGLLRRREAEAALFKK